MKTFDLAVIGGGPSGFAAAMRGLDFGKRVALIERGKLGGAGIFNGALSSKTLWEMSELYKQTRHTGYGYTVHDCELSFSAVIHEMHRAVGSKHGQLREQVNHFRRTGQLEELQGHGKLLNAHEIEIALNEGGTEVIRAEHIVLAIGSRPRYLPDIPIDEKIILTSDGIASLTDFPKSIVILGAGVIGCEYASIFGGLGAKVELINPAGTLLSFLDWEISDALSYHLRNAGVRSRHNEEYDRLEYFDTHIITHLKSGKRIKSDIVLWANGRTGNTDQLNLAAIGLKPNSRGQLEIDNRYRTGVDNIYAAGDVVGWPSLASVSYDQGRAASNAIVDPAACVEIDRFATGIYTIPEISTLGKTERELTSERIPYEVGKAFFKNTARGLITGEQVGMLKILFHFDTLEILGIHCFGDQASEIVHIGQAIMLQEGKANTMRYFLDTTFNYPTMAEAYRIAALDGLNRLSI